MDRRYRMARFPRLRELREGHLGWEVADLVAKLPDGKPSTASVYRLERGEVIRLPHVRRVFDVINTALGGVLDPAAEIIEEKESPSG